MGQTLQLSSVSKTYTGAKTKAVDDLSLSLHEGEIYGFLGANGAGKSTTIRMILDFVRPTSGSIKIFGKDAVDPQVRKRVGYLAGDVALWPDVTGHDIFQYLAQLHGNIDREYLQNLVTRFEAEPHKKIATLSKGNRQKIGIIQALLHQPDLLVLDEPTSGLDPLMQEEFYATIREASESGTTVFMSSHNIAEAERLCSKVGILKNGKLIHEQFIEAEQTLSKPIFSIQLSHQKDVAWLQNSAHVSIVRTTDTTVVCTPKSTIQAALADLAKVPIASLKVLEPSLEDEFLDFYVDHEEKIT